MKLSKDAKEHIAAEIAAAFAPKLKELRVARDRAERTVNTQVAEIHGAVKAFIDETVYPGFVKILGKYGKLDPEFVNADKKKFSATLSFPYAGGKYGSCNAGRDSDDTIGALGLGKERNAARDAVYSLESEIRRRVSYALYEIEVFGNRKTLDSIVRKAIETEIGKLK